MFANPQKIVLGMKDIRLNSCEVLSWKLEEGTAGSGFLHCLGRGLVFADGILPGQQDLLLNDILQQ